MLTAVHSADGTTGPRLDAVDHLFNFFGGPLGTLGKGAYRIRNYGKAATSLTRASGFDGRVQCQQVGLSGDVSNHLEYVADVVGTSGELMHLLRRDGDVAYQLPDRNQRLIDLVAAVTSSEIGAFRGDGGVYRVVSDVFNRTAHLFDCGRCLIDFFALKPQITAGLFGDGM
ncbi:hypothetical protein D3C80_1423460 [compost metagenome]